MQGTGFAYRGLEVLQKYGSPKIYQTITQLVRTPEWSEAQIEKFQQLGTRVGLNRKEVKIAISPSPNKIHGRTPGRLAWFIILLAILVSFLIGFVLGTGLTQYSTYLPGWRYAALFPIDFE